MSKTPSRSQFLILRRLCSDDSYFSNKSEEMRHFFKNRGYPDSVVNTAQHPAQHADWSTVSTANVTEGKE